MAVSMWLVLALVVVGVGLFVGSWRFYRRYRLIADTPTSKAMSMAVGPVELHGRAVPVPGGAPFEGPLSGEPCVYWSCIVEEQRTRTVKTKNGTRTETYWATVDRHERQEPFGLEDESGVACVDPRGVSVPAPRTSRYGSRLGVDPPKRVIDYLQGRGRDFESLFGWNKTMRYTERALPPGTGLYALGNAVRRDDAPAGAVGNEALVVQKEGRVPMLLSEHGEDGFRRRTLAAFWGAFLGGVALLGFAVYLWRLAP